jgi:hypothetical protein
MYQGIVQGYPFKGKLPSSTQWLRTAQSSLGAVLLYIVDIAYGLLTASLECMRTKVIHGPPTKAILDTTVLIKYPSHCGLKTVKHWCRLDTTVLTLYPSHCGLQDSEAFGAGGIQFLQHALKTMLYLQRSCTDTQLYQS